VASFELSTPDGARYQIEAPDEATAIAAFNSQFGDGSALGFKAKPPRTGNAALDVADAVVRGAANTATFGMADRLAAYMTPGDYGENVKKEWEKSDLARKDNPVATAVGDIGGVAAQFPFLPARLAAVAAPTRIGRAAEGAAQGAVLGGLQGLGQSRKDDIAGKAGDALNAAAFGGVAGGALGAILPRMTMPQAGQVPGRPNSEIVEAATRAGIPLPAVAASENRVVQQAGRYLEDLPLVGTPLQKARDVAMNTARQKLDDVAAGYGRADAASAGAGIQQAIERYAKTTLPGQQRQAYGAVTALTSQAKNPLTEVNNAVADILAKRIAGGLPNEVGAVGLVENAITRPGGLTAEGIQTLRSNLGEHVRKVGLNPTMREGEVKQLYGAATKDYRDAVTRSGGPSALQALLAADRLTKRGKERIASLAGLNRGTTGGESVVSQLTNWALDGGRGNIARLHEARRVASRQEWGDVAASVIGKLGTSGRTGEFSPAYLVSNWEKMSRQGKNALFAHDPAHRQALEDIVKTAKGLQNLEQFANKSRSGVVATISGTTAGLLTAPVATIGAAFGGRMIAEAMARPVTAQSLASYSKAYNAFVTAPSAATMNELQRRAGAMGEAFARHFGVPANDVTRVVLQQVRSAADPEQ